MKLEDQFRDKLKNHQVDWDKEELLGDLKQSLHQDKRRFRLWWLLSLLVLLILAFVSWKGCMHSAKELTMTAGNESTVVTNKTATTSKSSNNEDVSKLLSLENTGESVESNTTNQNETNNLERNDLDNTSQQTLTDADLESDLSKTAIVSTILSDRVSPLLEMNDTNQMKVSKLNKIKEHSSNVSPSNGNNQLKSETSIGLNKVELPIQSNESNSSARLDLNTNHSWSNTVISSIQLSNISRLGLNGFDVVRDQPVLPGLSSIDTTYKVDLKGPKSGFFLSLSSDIGLGIRSRTYSSSNLEYVNRLKSNDDTEKTLNTFNTSVNLGYQLSSGCFVQSGLEYTRITEVFNYSEESTEPVTKLDEDYSYVIIDLINMDTTYFYDSINVIRSTQRNIRHYNTQTLVSIPLQVGYQFTLNNMKLVTRLGLSYTFAYDFDGRVNQVIEDGGNQILDLNSEDIFSLKSRIGFQLGLGVAYPFLDKHEVFFSSTFRRSPTIGQVLIDQRYHSFSLGAGLRYSFGT